MAVEVYYPAPDFLGVYEGLLPRFGAGPDLESWARMYAAGHAGRCLWDVRFLSRLGGIGSLLNIGGAPYLFEAALKHENPSADVVTVDLDPGRFPAVEKTLGLRVLQGDIESADWGIGEEFDYIVLAEVFEHLHVDPLGAISRLQKHLAPGGTLYLTTPNGLGFLAWFKHLIRGRTGPSPVIEWEKLSRLGHMGHVREYSLVEVTDVLRYCGLRVERTIFRKPEDGRWFLRDTLISLRSSLAEEMVILARKDDNLRNCLR